MTPFSILDFYVFLNFFVLESITERESASLPWLLEMPTKDWFIGRVLKAWNRVGDLTSQHSILEPAMQQLLVYCQSNLNENLSMKQVGAIDFSVFVLSDFTVVHKPSLTGRNAG